MINSGILYVVATPIGNLQDISLRAIDTLNNADLCAAEDTRNSLKLFSFHGITTKLISFHDHSSSHKIEELINKLISGKNIALVSDAGTPSISDPGYVLVKKAVENSIQIVPVPGSSAITSILSVAGIASEKFIFQGFPPRKGKKREDLLRELNHESKASIFFESSLRIRNLLEDINRLNPKRNIVLGRELTKLHEVIYRGSIESVIEQLSIDPFGRKGEFVLLIEGVQLLNKEKDLLTQDEMKIINILLSKFSKKEALGIASEILGIKKNNLYKILLER